MASLARRAEPLYICINTQVYMGGSRGGGGKFLKSYFFLADVPRSSHITALQLFAQLCFLSLFLLNPAFLSVSQILFRGALIHVVM